MLITNNAVNDKKLFLFFQINVVKKRFYHDFFLLTIYGKQAAAGVGATFALMILKLNLILQQKEYGEVEDGTVRFGKL